MVPSPRQPAIRRAVQVKVPGRPAPPPKRIQVVNKTEPSGTASSAEPTRTPEPATTPPAAGDRLELALAAAIVLVALTTLILQFTLPWIKQPGRFGDTEDRKALSDQFRNLSFYTRGLLLWPVVSLVGLIVAGAVIALSGFVAIHAHAARALRLAAWGTSALLAFVLLLETVRLVGALLMNVWSNQSDASPQAALYVNAAVGLALLGVSLWRLRVETVHLPATPAMRWSAWATLIVAAALLLGPLVPYAKIVFPGPANDSYVGELSLNEGFVPTRAKDDFGFALGMLWVSLYVGLASWAASLAQRDGRMRPLWATISQVHALNVVPILVGLIFSILLYVHLPQRAGAFGFAVEVKLAFNFILAVGFGALGVVYAYYLVRVLLPFVRQHAAASSTPLVI